MTSRKNLPKHKRVCIAMCLYGTVTVEWFVHWEKHHIPSDIQQVWSAGAMIAIAANKCVKEALTDPDWTYLFFSEQDNFLAEGFLDRVIEYTELANPPDIAGGLYYRRSLTNPEPICYFWSEDTSKILHINPEQEAYYLDHPGLHEVDVVPMGCTAIHRRVFENWREDMMPWFATPIQRSGEGLTHDTYFCRSAVMQGFHVFVDTDPRMLSGHETRILVNHRTAQAVRMAQFKQEQDARRSQMEVLDGAR